MDSRIQPDGLEPSEAPRQRGRVKRAFSASRELVKIAYRDPEHVSERLTLYATTRLGSECREWARAARTASPDTHPAVLAERLRHRSANIARVDGAISGTPFFIALVPGYLTYLVQEMRMTLRTAALYGRDPRQLETAAEMLALRGVHPDVETARAALIAIQRAGAPQRPTRRRSLRMWIHAVSLVLVFGGFMSPSVAKDANRGVAVRVRAALGLLIAGALWLMTWVLPLTFMIMMAWGCESHARQLGRRTLAFYDGDGASMGAAIALADERRDRGHRVRAMLRASALFLSVAIPIGFVAYANHIRNSVGVNWVGAVGALVALSLVIATAIVSSRG